MKQIFRYTHRAALHLLLSSLVALALLLSLLRFWLLPELSRFREPLAGEIGALIGEPVRIERLSARLHGFHPALTVEGFHLLDTAGRSAIRFATVRLDLDLWRSVATGGLCFDRVEIIGPRLALGRRADGSLGVQGLSSGGEPPAWILAARRLDLLDAEVDWREAGAATPPLRLGRVDLRLRNDGDRHRLGANFRLPAATGRSLRLLLDAEGDLWRPAGWHGTLYLEGRDLAAGPLAAALPAAAVGLDSGRLDGRAWLRWSGGPGTVSGDFELRAPVFVQHPEGSAPRKLALQFLASRFRWQPLERGWRLDLAGLRPEFHQPRQDSRVAIALQRRADGGMESLAAAVSRVDLGDLGRVLHWFPELEGPARAALEGLAPAGSLLDTRLFLAPERPAGERLAVAGRVEGLAGQPWRGVPGFGGVAATFRGTDAGGWVALSTASGRLDFPAQGLKQPIALKEFATTLAWRRTEAEWLLGTPRLVLGNDDLRLETRARLRLPRREPASPFLELAGRIAGLEFPAVYRYLPTTLFPGASGWIQRALKAGRVSRLEFLFHGRTADYPFYRHEGVFETELDLDGLAMHYSQHWAPLTEATVRAAFLGPGAEAEVLGGRVDSGRVIEARAYCADLVGPTPWVELNGRVRAGVPETMEFLARSPLQRIPERLRTIMSTSGDADIDLAFLIPLGDGPGDLRVDGTARLLGAGLRLAALDLPVEDLRGELRFDQEGLRAESIAARIFGEPARITVDHEDDQVLVTVLGRAGVAALNGWFPAEAWRHASGAANYRVDLAIPESLDHRSDPLKLALGSDLAGLALDLPPPFGKPAAESRPLSLEATFRAGAPLPLRLGYGQDLRARLKLAEAGQGFRLESGDIAIGQPLPAGESRSGVTLAARLGTLDAGEWRPWLGRAEAGGMAANPLRELHLQLGKLAWNGTDLGRLGLDLKRAGTRWTGRIEGGLARGSIAADPDLVRVDLDNLAWPRAATAAPAAPDARPRAAAGTDRPAAAAIDPASVPGLWLRARRLAFGDADLGGLELRTERHAHGMIIQSLTVTGKDHRLQLRGNWTRTPLRAASTHLEGRLHLDSLGRFLAGFGRGGTLRDTASELSFALDWPGAPLGLSAATVAGEVKLALGKGGLLAVEPGLGRVVGMLNLNSLWRRLSLDFSDLFGKGLAYDGVAGTFRLGDGQAVTDALRIDAVSARILVTGRAGLVARDQDLLVTVIPHTTAALPIAGTLAGGPAVGAALYVAQQLVGDQVDSIAATRYTVRGAWDQPEITQVHRNLPLDVIDRAWSGVKTLSGFGSKPQEEQQ